VNEDRQEPTGSPVDDGNPFAHSVLFQFEEQRRGFAVKPRQVGQVAHDGTCLPVAKSGNLPDVGLDRIQAAADTGVALAKSKLRISPKQNT
jgi:hypothetical protein